MRLLRHSVFAVLVALVSAVTVWGQQAPIMDYTSVLETLDVYHLEGRLQLDANSKLTAAFLPDGAKVDAVITKVGSSSPLRVQDFYVQRLYGAFWDLSQRGKHKEFKFTESGDYQITYRANGKPMTTVKFSIDIKTDGDDFDPKRFFFMNGPWNEWAQLRLPLNDGKPLEATPKFFAWYRKQDFVQGKNAVEYQIEVRKDGDMIANCDTVYAGAQEWTGFEKELRFPRNKGGNRMKLKELLARDGTYDIVVTRAGELHAVYQLKIENGKPLYHARQSKAFQPTTEKMITRMAGEDIQGGLAANVVWMKRLSAKEAARVYSEKAATVAGPTSDDLRRWQWRPSADSNRPFQLVVTDIETRSDTSIQAGDDIVVFGTEYPKGVKYIRVGDEQARDIPGGETYHSMVFRTCGKKIALVKGKGQVVIFDTATDRLTEIPESDIFLYDIRGGNHRANLMYSDGNLLVTVNNVSKVTDKTIIKVIDVSGDQPMIVPIKNGDYVQSDVSSVTVSARQGIVAVSSAQKHSLFAAKIAPLARQVTFDLREYRGVNRNQIHLADEAIVYLDKEGKVRYLKLGTAEPKALVEERIGSSGNGFTVRKDRLVIATAKKYGTRYHMAMSDLPAKPRTLPATGDKIEGTSGGLGMAGCAAIAIDKTVFLAGTPSGGIGVGEHLQVLDKENNAWLPVYNQHGKVVTAIDATTSVGLLAFKSADRDRKTTVGYATYGEHIDLSQVPTKPDVHEAKPATSPNSQAPESVAEDKLTELEVAYLKNYLESEKQLIDSLTQAFGAEEGKKKARDGIIKAMKEAGQDKLIPIYKQYAAEKLRSGK